jgi:murein DD-endopeptidase MepM/ murein hydrolase activator NlpD
MDLHVLHFLSKVKIFRRIMIGILLGTVFLSSACSSGSVKGEDWAYPFPLVRSNECYKVATPFSVENPWDHAHEAIDFACLQETPVHAVQAGVIEKIIYTEVLGEKRAQITLALSDFPVRVEYLNLKQVEVQEGQAVVKGAQLGLTAIGLHFAVWEGEQGIYVDPTQYLTLPVPEEILK